MFRLHKKTEKKEDELEHRFDSITCGIEALKAQNSKLKTYRRNAKKAFRDLQSCYERTVARLVKTEAKLKRITNEQQKAIGTADFYKKAYQDADKELNTFKGWYQTAEKRAEEAEKRAEDAENRLNMIRKEIDARMAATRA